MCVFFGRSGIWSGERSFWLCKSISVRHLLRGVRSLKEKCALCFPSGRGGELNTNAPTTPWCSRAKLVVLVCELPGEEDHEAFLLVLQDW